MKGEMFNELEEFEVHKRPKAQEDSKNHDEVKKKEESKVTIWKSESSEGQKVSKPQEEIKTKEVEEEGGNEESLESTSKEETKNSEIENENEESHLTEQGLLPPGNNEDA